MPQSSGGSILLAFALLAAPGFFACGSGGVRDAAGGAGASGDTARESRGAASLLDHTASPPCRMDGRGLFPLLLTDDAGRRVRFESPPSRIVSLVPSVTRILVAVGAEGRLAGRTEFDTLPPVDTLPSVGGGLDPSLERLVALKPDLVVGFAGSSDRSTAARLDGLGIRRLEVRPDGIDDVRRIIGVLGCVVGAPDRADSLVTSIDSALSRVAVRVASLPLRRTAVLIGGSPPWVAGPGSYVDQLLRVAGGLNVFGDLGRLYGPVSREAFVSRDIDVILALPGVKPNLPVDVPVVHVPADVQTPGPDLGRAAEELARALHPEAYR